MSASEKLKALEVTYREKYWDSGTRDNNAESLGFAMRDALPQIVAVVEAAAELRRAENDHSWGLQPDGRMKDWEKRHDKNKAQVSLDAALTALDEALA